jgi:short-subunit dehydrogenase
VIKGKRYAVSAEQCAAAIVRGLERRRRTVVTPRAGWLLVWANRLFPRLVEWQLGLA